jgi:hypothetical protein
VRRLCLGLALGLLANGVWGAALPPQANALLPAIQAAEQRLQGASLQLEAARHDAEPLQVLVDRSRAEGDSWWAAWLLKRRLGQLKVRLDSVEAARAEQAAAHQDLVLLLTGADEEISGALEQSLSEVKNDGMNATWAAWWRQKQAWQQRLAALQPQDGAPPAGQKGQQPSGILREAWQIQAQREKALLDALGRRRALSAKEWSAERARQKLYFQSSAPRAPGP